ncbi:MAG TPA: hypothetical protein VFH58_12150 [Acidimicrobiales bacterium]|nr:hypothetical protein [Acidimicrobiales bacterium]
MKFQMWHIPVRAVTGAFILNSGLSKLKADDEELHKGIHGMASTAYPQFQSVDPKTFTKALGAGETALGAALLAPFVSPGVAGAALTAFSAGLVGLYFRVPGMTQDGIRPSQQGIALAKDSWLLSIGVALLLDRASKKVRNAIPLSSVKS